MILSLRKLTNHNLIKKLYLIKLKSHLNYELIESWRVQKYELIMNKKFLNNNFTCNFNIIATYNNINYIINLIKYNYLFNKFNINIDLIIELFNNIYKILFVNKLKIDEILEYVISDNYLNYHK